MHPRYEVPQDLPGTRARGPSKRATSSACEKGIDLEDGPTPPGEGAAGEPERVELTIHEGRNGRCADARGDRASGRPSSKRTALGRCAWRASRRAPSASLTPAEVEPLWKNHRP